MAGRIRICSLVWLSSWHPYGSLSPTVTPVPGASTPSSDLPSLLQPCGAHKSCRYTPVRKVLKINGYAQSSSPVLLKRKKLSVAEMLISGHRNEMIRMKTSRPRVVSLADSQVMRLWTAHFPSSSLSAIIRSLSQRFPEVPSSLMHHLRSCNVCIFTMPVLAHCFSKLGGLISHLGILLTHSLGFSKVAPEILHSYKIPICGEVADLRPYFDQHKPRG